MLALFWFYYCSEIGVSASVVLSGDGGIGVGGVGIEIVSPTIGGGSTTGWLALLVAVIGMADIVLVDTSGVTSGSGALVTTLR